MPGTFGYFRKNRDLPLDGEGLLTAMGQSLKHRDSYRIDRHSGDLFGLGRVDVNRSVHRPIFADRRNGLLVAFYGDLYKAGAPETSLTGDPEQTVAKLYAEYGAGAVRYLNGDFHGALWNPAEGRALLFSDRFGFRHLYVYEDENVVLFAPEPKAFRAYSGFDATLDPQGLADFFNFAYALGERTLLKRVRLLPAASVVTLEASATRTETYWRPRYTRARSAKDLPEAVETGFAHFRTSLERKLAGADSAVVPLSGGLDSRLIVGTATLLGHRVRAATFGIPGCLEHSVAKEVCASLGLAAPIFVEVRPEWLREFGPQAARFTETSHPALELTNQHGFEAVVGTDYGCFLNGIFGGHLTFGPTYFNDADLAAPYENDAFRRGRLLTGFNGQRYDTFLRPYASWQLNEIADAYRFDSIDREWEATADASEIGAYRRDAVFVGNRLRRAMNAVDQNRFFYNDKLVFQSYELYDFYLSLDTSLSGSHRLYKEIYKSKFPRLAEIRWWTTGVNLYQQPSSLRKFVRSLRRDLTWYVTRLSSGRINIRNREDEPHNDAHYRMSKAVRDWVETLLLSDQCLGRGYFTREGLRELLARQRAGQGLFHEISKIVTFELWARSLEA